MDFRPSPDAMEMADALRSGAASRRSQVDAGDPGADAARLSDLGNLEGLPPLAKPGPAAPFVKVVRALLRVFLRPWLAAQTIFNREIGRLSDAMLTAVRDLLRRMTRFEESLRELEGRIQSLERARGEGSGETAARSVEVQGRDIEEMFVHSCLPRPPARVLLSGSAACGIGAELASFGFEVCSVDAPAPGGGHSAMQVRQAAAGVLPFADASFDAVVRLGALETGSPDAPAASASPGEIARVLKPGGRFIASLVPDARTPAAALVPLTIADLMFASRDGATWQVRTLSRPPDGASMMLVSAERR